MTEQKEPQGKRMTQNPVLLQNISVWITGEISNSELSQF